MNAKSLCRHFGSCGGCSYQDMPDAEYRVMKRASVVDALRQNGLGDVHVEEIVEIGPATRRRAAFKAAKIEGVTHIGFHALSSHDIVDMQECRVLTPALAALVPGLRAMMNALLNEGEKAELFATETAGGPDVAMRWRRRPDAAAIAEAASWASRLNLARLTANGELMAELAQPFATFGKARVALPPSVFLQPSSAGEAVLQEKVRTIVKGAKTVADLFAGCGTFSLTLAEQARVHAVEADKAASEALAAAARGVSGLKPVTVERRDLFKRPLAAAELARFDAVVLDPPRAGAAAQAKELAMSKVGRIAYVSCNPSSFARDARVLAGGGYRAGTVTPVDQFLWSSHIELAAGFARD